MLAFLAGLLPSPAAGQITVGADIGVTSGHQWRGLTRTSRATIQPSVIVGLRGSSRYLSIGVREIREPFSPQQSHLSEAGRGRLALGQRNLWVQIDQRIAKVGQIDLTSGLVQSTFHGDTARGGRGGEWDTAEFFIKSRFSHLGPIQSVLGLHPDLPLAADLSAWFDLKAVGGFYGEAAIEAMLPIFFAGEPVNSIVLRSHLGISLDQTRKEDGGLGYYERSGITHAGLALSLPVACPIGSVLLSFLPAAHLQIGVDPATRRRSSGPTVGSSHSVWTTLTASITWPLRRLP